MQITAEQLWGKVGRQAVEIELLQQELTLAQQRVAELEAAHPAQPLDNPEEGYWRDAAVATARLTQQQANGSAAAYLPAGQVDPASVLPGNGDSRD